jgi:hypothetical protein
MLKQPFSDEPLHQTPELLNYIIRHFLKENLFFYSLVC